MTQNQIAYWSLQETKRSNLARETETHRTNVVYEKETKRHNLVTEAETNRHNVTTEVETERHNRATELLQSQANAEVARHNAAGEMIAQFNANEAARSNRENERLKEQANAITYALGSMNVGLGYAQLGEQTRHNLISEHLTSYAETERARANRENEFNVAFANETQRQHLYAQDTNSFLQAASSTRNSATNEGNLTETKDFNKHKKKIDWANVLIGGANTLVKGAGILQ